MEECSTQRPDCLVSKKQTQCPVYGRLLESRGRSENSYLHSFRKPNRPALSYPGSPDIYIYVYIYIYIHTQTHTHTHMVKVKVKQSLYRPRQTLRFPGVGGSQISRQSVREGGTFVNPMNGHLYPSRYISGTHFCQKLRLTQGRSTAKRITSITPSGIEPATFRLVAQCSTNSSTACLYKYIEPNKLIILLFWTHFSRYILIIFYHIDVWFPSVSLPSSCLA